MECGCLCCLPDSSNMASMESISSLGDIQAVQLPDHAPSTSDDEDYTKVMSRKTSAIWGPKSMAIPTSQTGPVVEDDIHRYSGRSLVLVTVGLPARGMASVRVGTVL